MYTILVQDDNELIPTVRERIMQRSNLVDTFQFLVNPLYNNLDMTQYTVLLEYITPVTKTYRTEILELQEELYKEKLQYLLPSTTKITEEPGEVELQLTFTNADLDENGSPLSYVRKTNTLKIKVLSIADWSQYIPDEALNSIDQKILSLDARVNALNEIADIYSKNQVDDLKLTDDLLQVSASGVAKGVGVQILVPVDDPDSESGDGIIDIKDDGEAGDDTDKDAVAIINL